MAQQTVRATIARALAAPGLTKTDLRVLMALIALVAFFDRTEDHVATAQIVEQTGLDERHVRRSLARLHEHEVIVRTPGTGRTAPHIDLRSRAEVARAEVAT